MAKEAIDAVLAAEQTAREIIAAARLEATAVTKEATVAADQIASDNRRAVAAREQEINDEAELEGQTAGAPLLERAQREASLYDQLSDQDLEPLAKVLVERVVGYGNR